MIDEELLKIINSGKCFAFVGSGPSCEMGIPSWRELAERIYEEVKKECAKADPLTYERYLQEKKYPELFEQAQHDWGYENLVKSVKLQLVAKGSEGTIYQYLAKWPFACYLTTNFDDYLKQHLDQTGAYFVVLRNVQEDMRKISVDTSNVIVKLHGDCSDPDNLVLTYGQYKEFQTSPSREYFRRKLGSIFEMFRVLVIGHSLTDPDIKYILEVAQQYSSPQRPIFMMLADPTQGEIQEFYEHRNIRIIPYKNPDGSHSQLRVLLRTIGPFIAPRNPREVPEELLVEEDEDLASSLFLYTKLQIDGKAEDFGADIYKVLVLGAMKRLKPGETRTAQDLLSTVPIETLASGDFDVFSLNRALVELEAASLIERSPDSNELLLTEEGRISLEEVYSQRVLLKEQIFGQAQMDIVHEFPDITLQEKRLFIDALEKALVAVFQAKGLDITSSICGLKALDLPESPDVFRILNDVSGMLPSLELRAFFIDYARRFLVQPIVKQRQYLWHLSQGYFAYHALSLDPKCYQFRRECLESTLWLLDSSVILPLIARNCHNHQYALDLFERIKRLNVRCFTTSKLFDEAVEHVRWAEAFVEKNGTDSLEFLRAAILESGYKQNLFIGGFIETATLSGYLTFDKYMQDVFGDNEYEAAISAILAEYGVHTCGLTDWPGFKQEDWGDVQDVTEKIIDQRIRLGTYRSDRQAMTEAEVFVVLRNERQGRYTMGCGGGGKAFFVSQSGVLNHIAERGERLVWRPEALYRYLLCFPGGKPNEDYLQQCMTHEYFYAGIEVFNEQRYKKFFGSFTQQAKLRFQEVRVQYESTVEERFAAPIDEAFDRIPDLEKPFFVMQMDWKIAGAERERAEAERQRAEVEKQRAEAEARLAAKRARDAELSEKERGDYERLKAKREQRRKRGKKR